MAGGAHRVIAPGEKIAIKGLTSPCSPPQAITSKKGAQSYCRPAPVEGETGENPQSAGVLIHSRFFADPGDIIWNEELALECPANKVAARWIFTLTAHHATHILAEIGLLSWRRAGS
jgi:hypothetical protein